MSSALFPSCSLQGGGAEGTECLARWGSPMRCHLLIPLCFWQGDSCTHDGEVWRRRESDGVLPRFLKAEPRGSM